MNRKEWESNVRSNYTKTPIFSPGRIIEKKSGDRYGLLNNTVEFNHKGLTYKLNDWVETKLTVLWSDGSESVQFISIWLPNFLKWLCIQYIIKFHPNRHK